MLVSGWVVAERPRVGLLSLARQPVGMSVYVQHQPGDEKDCGDAQGDVDQGAELLERLLSVVAGEAEADRPGDPPAAL